MNQERAILHFNKFKSLKNAYVKDTLMGHTYLIVKVKLIKVNDSDYEVKIFTQSELAKETLEFDSNYAHLNFREIKA